MFANRGPELLAGLCRTCKIKNYKLLVLWKWWMWTVVTHYYSSWKSLRLFPCRQQQVKWALLGGFSLPYLHKWKPENNAPLTTLTQWNNKCLGQRMTRMEMDYNLTFAQSLVLCLYLAQNHWKKLTIVCSPCEVSLDTFLLVFQEDFMWAKALSWFHSIALRILQSGPQPELDIWFPAIWLVQILNQNIGLAAKGLSSR